MFETLTQSEGDILLWIQNNIRNPFMTPVVNSITSLGNAGWFWIAVTVLMILIPGILLYADSKKAESERMTEDRRKKLKRILHVGHLSAGALIWSLIINNLILKPLVNRVRPYNKIEGLTITVKPEKDASFPSGHTGASIASAWVLFKELPKKYGVPALVLAILISLSRLYVGVHYPTDVLGGAVSGLVSAELGRLVFGYIGKKYEEKREG